MFSALTFRISFNLLAALNSLFGIMWPAPHPTLRSSAGPTPGLPGPGPHYASWPPSTSAAPQIHGPGHPVPVPPHRDFAHPPMDLHHYSQSQTPASQPPMSFGLPPPEPTPTLE